MRFSLDAVSHRFGDLLVLDDMNLAVREGETLALIGPSGCGKSTLLSIVGGLLRPSSGRVLVSGEPPPGSLNPFTYVFQDFALLPWRSVWGNVALPLEEHALSRAERAERVAHVLAITGLSDFAEAHPHQLSGGMRQRVGIARALVVKPAILFMDEPLSSLDAQARELLMEDFMDLWLREKTTAVYVTHNLDEALRLADRVAVLSRRPGRIKEIVEIPVAQAERRTQAGQQVLACLHDRLWSLIKQEAKVADREVLHG
jgi:NitT/TauT family transport system ATP-binding protein